MFLGAAMEGVFGNMLQAVGRATGRTAIFYWNTAIGLIMPPFSGTKSSTGSGIIRHTAFCSKITPCIRLDCTRQDPCCVSAAPQHAADTETSACRLPGKLHSIGPIAGANRSREKFPGAIAFSFPDQDVSLPGSGRIIRFKAKKQIIQPVMI